MCPDKTAECPGDFWPFACRPQFLKVRPGLPGENIISAIAGKNDAGVLGDSTKMSLRTSEKCIKRRFRGRKLLRLARGERLKCLFLQNFVLKLKVFRSQSSKMGFRIFKQGRQLIVNAFSRSFAPCPAAILEA